MPVGVHPYEGGLRGAVIELSLRAWAPVFEKMEPAVQPYVYRAFYPQGWEARQAADIAAFLDSDAHNILVALDDDTLAGWVGVRIHPADSMGEIYILAVDPDFQRRGVATALMSAAFERMRGAGMQMVMVETGGDPGHEGSRATYESMGFEQWPVARYFREL